MHIDQTRVDNSFSVFQSRTHIISNLFPSLLVAFIGMLMRSEDNKTLISIKFTIVASVQTYFFLSFVTSEKHVHVISPLSKLFLTSTFYYLIDARKSKNVSG